MRKDISRMRDYSAGTLKTAKLPVMVSNTVDLFLFRAGCSKETECRSLDRNRNMCMYCMYMRVSGYTHEAQ